MRKRKLIKSIVCVILFLAIACFVFISQLRLEKERYRPTQEYALTSDIKDRISLIASDNPIEVIKALMSYVVSCFLSLPRMTLLMAKLIVSAMHSFHLPLSITLSN